MERTSISDVEQHGHKDVVHQVQSNAVSEQGVPHHQQVLKGKLPAEQQSYPPAAGQTPEPGNAIAFNRASRKGSHTHTHITRGVDTDMP